MWPVVFVFITCLLMNLDAQPEIPNLNTTPRSRTNAVKPPTSLPKYPTDIKPKLIFSGPNNPSSHNLNKRYLFKPSNDLSRSDCIHNICDNVDNYPTEYIKGILRRTDAYDNFFGSDATIIKVEERFKPDDEGETLCMTQSTVKKPKIGTNIKKQDVFLINTDEYEQTVVVEECVNEGKPCKNSEYFPNHISVCRQKYVIKRLMALKDDGKTGFDQIELPSCCVCHLIKK